MTALEMLHDDGQSLWLDHLTRELLTSRALANYVEALAVTGVTSNLAALHQAIRDGAAYDAAIRQGAGEGSSGEETLSGLLLDDLVRAADLFRPIWERTRGADGWASAPLSPLLAHDSAGMLEAARDLHARARRPNLLLELPGTTEGLDAAEEAIFAGLPVNVTLLFSAEQYRAAAEAYLGGLERRIAAGLDPAVGSFASICITHWGGAFGDPFGVAVGKKTYKAYRALLRSPRWQRLFKAGARPQRLVWANADLRHARALAAPFSVNTMSAGTLKTFAIRGWLVGIGGLPDRDSENLLSRLAAARIDLDALANQLQDEALSGLADSWGEMLDAIVSKGAGRRLLRPLV